MTIEKLVHGGSGMAAHEGRKVFVPFSAPGDVVEVEIVAEHPGYLEAELLAIVEPAPCRTAPRCPVFGVCGGCQWQHISYEAQLEWKGRILAETLARVGKIDDPPVLRALPSPMQWNYRDRMQLHVDSRGRVGYYRRGSKEVVEFEECAIAAEALNRELRERRGEISRRDRGIALRAHRGEGFSQINPGQNENLRALVCEWLGQVPHSSVLELHAGSGNFTFALARVAGSVIATEIDGRAVALAARAQERERACNVQFHRMDDARAVIRFGRFAEAVILDPPRKGCPEAIGAIAEALPRTVLYVSCDPATLSRDLRSLSVAGYRLIRAMPVDMFPQTFHIEALAMLSRS